MPINKSSSELLYIQIQKDLLNRIQSGELMPGSKIPSEMDLAEEYKVSRVTARMAIDKLVEQGKLYRKQGKGTYIAENSMPYDLSTMISFSKIMRSRGHEVYTKVLNQEIIPTMPELVDKLMLPQNSEVIQIRRLRYLDGQPAAIHTSYLDASLYKNILQIDLSKESLLESIEKLSGTKIAYSKDSVRAGTPSLIDARLLEIPKGSPVLIVEGVAYCIGGQPSRFIRSIFRGDKFVFTLINQGNSNTKLETVEY